MRLFPQSRSYSLLFIFFLAGFYLREVITPSSVDGSKQNPDLSKTSTHILRTSALEENKQSVSPTSTPWQSVTQLPSVSSLPPSFSASNSGTPTTTPTQTPTTSPSQTPPPSITPSPSQTPPPRLVLCKSCPDVNDGIGCLSEPEVPPRVHRRIGGGFDKCSEKYYKPPYTAVQKKRSTTTPWLSEDAFRELGDWIIDWMGNCPFSPETVRCGDVIFSHAGMVETFFTTHHARIKHPYVFITHASDFSFSADSVHQLVVGMGGGQRNLEQWFALNLVTQKTPPSYVSWIPLGLQGPGWAPDEWYPNFPETSAFGVPILRRKLDALIAGNLSRDNLLLVAFTNGNNPGERDAAQQAAAAMNFNKKEVSKASWAKAVQDHLFVLAPAGNGVDTHRIWETILNGAIPIVRTSDYDQWLSCLPYVRLNSWSELSESLLNKWAVDLLTAFDAGAFDFRRTMLSFHAGRIARAVERATVKCAPEARIEAEAARKSDAIAFQGRRLLLLNESTYRIG
jgi:hypothetical protein